MAAVELRTVRAPTEPAEKGLPDSAGVGQAGSGAGYDALMVRFFSAFLALALVSLPAVPNSPSGTKRVPAPPPVATEARTLLETQAAAWNRGDLDAFCSVYADDALFVTASGLTTGRAEVLARYRARYPDAAARGALSFDVLSVDELAPGAAKDGPAAIAVVARWTIARAGKPAASGLTLLNLARTSAGWRILHDASM